MGNTPRPFWPALLVGVVLGIGLLTTFMITGNGLGASGAITRATVVVNDALAPEATAQNAYFGPFIVAGAPLVSWITWEAIGIMAGAFLSAFDAGRLRVQFDRGPRSSTTNRILLALAGGAVVGFGSRLARGCTSGLGLSGASTLAVAGFVFLIGFFAAGFAMSLLYRRAWQ